MKINLKDQRVSLLLIISITFILYFPALSFDLLNFDDPKHLTLNRSVIEFDVKKIFTNFKSMEEVAPITFLSYAIEHYFFGLTPKVFHFTNIILHIFNSCLVFLITLIWSRKNLFISLSAALIFSLHPTHIESVAWISERKDVLSSFFLLLTIFTYYQNIEKPKDIKYFLSLIFFILAILSKFSTFLAPLILIGIDIKRKNFNKKSLLQKIPFILVSIVMLIINIQSRLLSSKGLEIEPLEVILKIIKGFSFYITKFVVPFNLSPYYDKFYELDISFYILPVLLVCLIIYSLKRWEEERLEILFFSLFFALYIFPSFKIIHFGSEFTFANRYLYFSSIPLTYLIFHLLQKISNPKVLKYGSILFITLILLPSFKFLYAWENNISLWKHAVRVNSNSPVAYGNLGASYLQERRVPEAKIALLKSLEIDPEYVESLVNLAAMEGSAGFHHLSAKYYEKALDAGVKQEFLASYLYSRRNLIPYLAKRGEFQTAILIGENGLKLDPENSNLRLNTGRVYFILKDYSKAKEHFLISIKNKKKESELKGIYYKLGQIYKNESNPKMAKKFFSLALKFGVQSAKKELQIIQ